MANHVLHSLAFVQIHVQILDENDNPPMFKELNYRLQIDRQKTPLHSRLVQLEAFDADEGLNGALYYSLIRPSPYFYIGTLKYIKYL